MNCVSPQTQRSKVKLLKPLTFRPKRGIFFSIEAKLFVYLLPGRRVAETDVSVLSEHQASLLSWQIDR